MRKYTVVIENGDEKEGFDFEMGGKKLRGKDPAVIRKEMDENCQGVAEAFVKERYPNRTFTVGTIDIKGRLIGFYVILGVKGKLKKQFKN